MSDIKYVKNPAKLLVDSGALMEINRTILHPLGLALAVDWPETPEEEEAAAKAETCIFRIWDNRSDPEGVYYTEEAFAENKFEKTVLQEKDRLQTRFDTLNYIIQGGVPVLLAVGTKK